MSLPQEPREELLEALRAAAPEQWRAEVRAVLGAYGRVEEAARALGVREGTLRRWVGEVPGLLVGIEVEDAL